MERHLDMEQFKELKT